MRVGIDAMVLGSGRGGDETFLRGVLNGLAAVARPDDQFSVFHAPDAPLPTELLGRSQFGSRTLPRRRGAVHFGATLPATLWRSPRDDVLFTLTHAPAWAPSPVVITVADLSFRHAPEHYRRSTRMRLEALVPFQARRARAVVAPSEFSRRDLVETLGVPETKVFVVPNVVEKPEPLPPERCRALDARMLRAGIREPFVLYLGNLHPRKNVARLIQAFRHAKLGLQLVVAGGRWWGAGAEEREVERAEPGTVVMLGRVDDECRQHLLQSAMFLAYPSLFEGFGLPPVEAMAVGTPALVSDRGALPEVCGDAALIVDALDLEAMSVALQQLVSDTQLRARLRERGRAQARKYGRVAAGMAALRVFDHAVTERSISTKGTVR